MRAEVKGSGTDTTLPRRRKLAMGKGFQGAMLRAMRVEEHTATVIESEWLTQHVVHITFHSDTLLNSDGELPASWVRVWFPDHEGQGKLHQRCYTLLHADPTTGVFSIAFLIHTPSGPASSWAVRARAGDELTMQRFGGDGFTPDDQPPRGYLFVGDAASWPAINAIIGTLPTSGTPIQIVMEQFRDDDTQLPFPDHPDLTVRWIPTRHDARALVDALEGHDVHGWRCWVAAESTATRLVKSHLELNFGHNRATLHSQAYWIEGRAMGKQVDVEPDTTADNSGADTADAAATEQTTTPVAASTSDAATSGKTADAKQVSVLRPARVALIISGLAQALLSITYIVPFILFSELAQRLVRGASQDELIQVGLVGVGILGFNTLGTAVLLFAQHVYDANYSAALRKRLLHKLSRLPLGWFKDRRSAEVKTLVQDNVSSLHYLITHAVPDMVGAVVTPLAILIYLFTVDWRLALVLLLPIVLYIVVTVRQASADKQKIARILRWNATISGDTERFVSGQAVSRVFGDDSTVNLPRELQEMGDYLITWQRSTLDSKLNSTQMTKPMSIMALLLLVGTGLVVSGIMPAENIIPFLILGTSFGDRLLAVSYSANGIREGLNAKKSLELLLTTPELSESSDGSQRDAASGVEDSADTSEDASARTCGNITVKDVSFSYSAGTRALNKIDLDIPAGTTTALVGPSGSGKSTFASLLARLWDPDDGAIVLDGVNLRDIPEDTLHRKVAVVLQDVQLIKGTLFDNIALGHPEATREDVRAAAQAAYIDDFIMSLPHGYDTPVDRKSLSGGQRQRVAIARALLGDPDVVVLDEATAAADPDSEWAVRKGLDALLEGRTKIIVAHRLHTIAHADRIVVLQHGDIAEQGTHNELVTTNGLYSSLASSMHRK